MRDPLQDILILSFWLLLFIIVLSLLLRSREIPDSAVAQLNLVALILVAIPIAQITRAEATRAHIQHNAMPVTYLQTHSSTRKKAPKDAPNIYHIILDAYARQDILKTRYNYDNSPFIDGLKQRGFIVANKAHTNYDETFLCSTPPCILTTSTHCTPG